MTSITQQIFTNSNTTLWLHFTTSIYGRVKVWLLELCTTSAVHLTANRFSSSVLYLFTEGPKFMQPACHAVAADLLCTWAKAQQQTRWPLPLTMISGTDRWTQMEGWSDRQTPQTLYDTFTVYYVDQCLQCFDAVGWAAGRASGL